MTEVQQDADIDRIERQIDIEASAERVWALIDRPGWWINEGSVDFLAEIHEGAGVSVVRHPTYGEFRVGVEESDPPHRLVYRWYLPGDEIGTRVEFTIAARSAGGVTLRVVETGFLALGRAHDEVLALTTERREGWTIEMAAARDFVMGER